MGYSGYSNGVNMFSRACTPQCPFLLKTTNRMNQMKCVCTFFLEAFLPTDSSANKWRCVNHCVEWGGSREHDQASPSHHTVVLYAALPPANAISLGMVHTAHELLSPISGSSGQPDAGPPLPPLIGKGR